MTKKNNVLEFVGTVKRVDPNFTFWYIETKKGDFYLHQSTLEQSGFKRENLRRGVPIVFEGVLRGERSRVKRIITINRQSGAYMPKGNASHRRKRRAA